MKTIQKKRNANYKMGENPCINASMEISICSPVP